MAVEEGMKRFFSPSLVSASGNCHVILSQADSQAGGRSRRGRGKPHRRSPTRSQQLGGGSWKSGARGGSGEGGWNRSKQQRQRQTLASAAMGGAGDSSKQQQPDEQVRCILSLFRPPAQHVETRKWREEIWM
ncbi:uncharacterized protein PHA67_014986 [Liasis olivaceus]